MAAVLVLTTSCASNNTDAVKAEPTSLKHTGTPQDIKVSQKTADFIGLQTAKVEARDIKLSHTLPAHIEPDIGKEVDVSARVPGRIDQIMVAPGDFVEAGHQLAIMTSREVSDLEAQAVAVLAKLETMKAQESREREVYTEQVQSPKALLDARAAVKEASLKVDLDESQLNRQTLLFNQNVGAEKDLLTAKAAFDQSEANLEHAKANLKREEALYKNRAVMRGPYQMAQAERIRAEKELQALKSQLNFLGVDSSTLATYLQKGTQTGVLKIVAPARGVISFFGVAPGELVTADKPIFRITDMTTVLISADVPAAEIRIAQLGSTMSVQIPGVDKPFAATIDYVANSVDPATRTFAVRARLRNAGQTFKPGMFADVTLDRITKTAQTVPKSAVQTIEGKTVVFVKTAEGFTEKPVEKGIEGEEFVEITRGLQVGELVAAQGSLMLKTHLSYGQNQPND